MPKHPSDNMVRTVLNKDENKRLKYFREKFIHKSQTEAAKLMGVSQASLSHVETFKRPVPGHYYDILANKYNINEAWLRSGDGTPQAKGVPVKNNLTTLTDMGTEIAALKREVAVLKVNQNLLLGFVERLIKTLSEHGVPLPKIPELKD